jgi:hypothetical protein
LIVAAQVADPEPVVPVSALVPSKMVLVARAGRCIRPAPSPADLQVPVDVLVLALRAPVSAPVLVLVRPAPARVVLVA